MRNEHNDDKRQAGQPGQQDNSDTKRQAGRQGQQDDDGNQRHAGPQDKSSKGFGTKSDSRDQEEAGKGKIATSAPGGEKSEPKRF